MIAGDFVMVISINKSPKTVKRDGDISYQDLRRSTKMHQSDVKRVLYYIADRLKKIGDIHDWSKDTLAELYYNDYVDSKRNNKDMHKGEWYKYHFEHERHHLMNSVPEDVNLLDVIEFIADCCCDGIAESGEPEKMEISDKLLRQAFDNTIKMITRSICLNTDDEE